MSKVGDVFQSNYLKASDLQGRAVEVEISGVKIEKLGQGNDAEAKPVLYFKGKQKGLVCNKTNARTVERIFGTDEMNDWVGGMITLTAREVEFQGETVLAIRINGIGGYKLPPKLALQAAPPVAGTDAPKDDIPF